MMGTKTVSDTMDINPKLPQPIIQERLLDTVTARASNHFQLTLPCYYNSLEFIIFAFTQGYYNCTSYKKSHSSPQHKIQTCLAMYILIHSYSYKWRQDT